MSESRTKNSFRNYGMSAISQVANILLNFIERTVFIKLLSIEYLGVNGLFSNILFLLSLAELGVGSAITYMMYKPIANNDIKKVAAYNQLFRNIYNFVGVFVLVVGLSLTPFIYGLIKEPPHIVENLYVIYALYVLNTSITYFFTYKRSLLIAYQKEYVNDLNIIEFAIIKDIVLIVLLFLFRNFYFYLLAQILITFASNLAISVKTNRLFPEVVEIKDSKVSREEIRIIAKNTLAMVCHKIGSVVVSGTGNIFISYYVGLALVGIYSNYLMIANCARAIVGKGISTLTASFGNYVATHNNEETYGVFKKIYFINFLVSLFIAVLFGVLVDPFVTVWLGEDFLLDHKTLLIIVVNTLFFYQLRIPCQMVINTYGLFWQIKWKSIFEALINLACSFLFTAYMGWGIMGIMLASLVSNISTNIWWEPYAATKYGLKIPLKWYFEEFFKNVFIFALIIVLLHYATMIMSEMSIISNMFLRTIASFLVISVVVFIFYRNTEEFSYTKSIVVKYLKNKTIGV